MVRGKSRFSETPISQDEIYLELPRAFLGGLKRGPTEELLRCVARDYEKLELENRKLRRALEELKATTTAPEATATDASAAANGIGTTDPVAVERLATAQAAVEQVVVDEDAVDEDAVDEDAVQEGAVDEVAVDEVAVEEVAVEQVVDGGRLVEEPSAAEETPLAAEPHGANDHRTDDHRFDDRPTDDLSADHDDAAAEARVVEDPQVVAGPWVAAERSVAAEAEPLEPIAADGDQPTVAEAAAFDDAFGSAGMVLPFDRDPYADDLVEPEAPEPAVAEPEPSGRFLGDAGPPVEAVPAPAVPALTASAGRPGVASRVGPATLYSGADDVAHTLLALAQRAARELRETTRLECELMLKKARSHAERIERDVERERESVNAELEELQLLRWELREQMRSSLIALLRTCSDGGTGQLFPLDLDGLVESYGTPEPPLSRDKTKKKSKP